MTTQLRGAVVFTVQNVLSDPPFSRIDLISCRNLLIYLEADAQAKVLSLFRFALRRTAFYWSENPKPLAEWMTVSS